MRQSFFTLKTSSETKTNNSLSSSRVKTCRRRTLHMQMSPCTVIRPHAQHPNAHTAPQIINPPLPLKGENNNTASRSGSSHRAAVLLAPTEPVGGSGGARRRPNKAIRTPMSRIRAAFQITFKLSGVLIHKQE